MTNFHTWPCELLEELADELALEDALAEAVVPPAEELDAAATVGAGLDEHRALLLDDGEDPVEDEHPAMMRLDAAPTAKSENAPLCDSQRCIDLPSDDAKEGVRTR